MNITQQIFKTIFQNSSNFLHISYALTYFDVLIIKYFVHYVVGIPQVILNGFVVIILILGFFLRSQKFKPGLVFVFNLALSDLLQGVLVATGTATGNSDYEIPGVEEEFLHDLEITQGFGCKFAVGTMSFVYTQAATATVLIAVDRYVTIAYWATHSKIMTKKVVIGLIFVFSWLLPAIQFVGVFFTIELRVLSFCNLRDLKSKDWTDSIGMIFNLALLVIYFLYFRIIFSFWKLKRKRSKLIRKNKRIVDDIEFCMAPRKIDFVRVRAGIIPMKQSFSNIRNENAFSSSVEANIQTISGINVKNTPKKQRKNSFPEQIHRIGRYIKASKYVIVIVIIFTISWAPWCVLSTVNQVGYYIQEEQSLCGESPNMNSSLSLYKQTYNSFGVRQIMEKENTTYFIYLNELDEMNSSYCSTLYESVLTNNHIRIQHILVILSSMTSIINPLVYAIWYQDFRQLVKDIIT